jgi:AcrR family transcriptional regulator
MKSKAKTGRRKTNAVRDPERTRARLLHAAREEFSQHGLSGARVSSIVDNAGVNKQLLYYYFGDKENLYAEVLERAYGELRVGEQALNLDMLAPDEAIRRFIEFNFDFLVEHHYFVALLNDENLHKARHIKHSEQLPLLHDRLRHTIGGPLKRGLADGTFRRKVDPVDLYISIASLCFFYHSNTHTMSVIFQRDLSAPEEIKRRRAHIVDLVIGYLTV